MTRNDFVALARTWKGTPFHHQGRLKGVGVDCIGYAVELAKEAHILTPNDITNYARYPHDDTLLLGLQSHLEEIPVKDILPGDILLFKIYKDPQHIAILTDLGIIHAVEQGVVETGFDDMWKKRLVKAFKLPGVDD